MDQRVWSGSATSTRTKPAGARGSIPRAPHGASPPPKPPRCTPRSSACSPSRSPPAAPRSATIATRRGGRGDFERSLAAYGRGGSRASAAALASSRPTRSTVAPRSSARAVKSSAAAPADLGRAARAPCGRTSAPRPRIGPASTACCRPTARSSTSASRSGCARGCSATSAAPSPRRRARGSCARRTRIEWEYTPSEFAALLEELRLIKRFRPRLNVAMKRDARHFAFIKLTRGPAPKLLRRARRGRR